jgi:hypothetical protein
MNGWRWVLCLVFVLGCNSKPHTLTPPAGCTDASVVACLQPLAYETLSGSALANVREEGEACFSKNKATLRKQASCLPLVMGTDAKGRGKVEMRYYCGDLCPDQGVIVAVLAGLHNLDACCVAGGDPLLNFANRSFRACMVPRASSANELCQNAKR